MIPARHFYMIRHGQTEANAAQIMAGSTDSPLTETGRQQAFEARDLIQKLPVQPTQIYHSPLSRAHDTAEIINEVLKVEMIADPDLAEICAGEWEGLSWEDCRGILDGWVQGPGGEHPEEFFQRVKRGKQRALKQSEGPVLIVCHGGVMRAFGSIHGFDTPGVFKNAHLYEFIPLEGEHIFPWDVFDYELSEDKQTLIRNISTTYAAAFPENSSAEEIAS